jgi:3-hydroxybutyryl-CoA dehydrogenase
MSSNQVQESTGTRIDTVGVVGMGVMGVGVAQCFAEAQIDVVALDLSSATLEAAKKEIASNVRMYRLFRRSAASAEALLERIRFTTDPATFETVHFVVENATESWAVKEPIYRRLDAVCPPAVCFAANTSCISITKIGAATKRPSRILGIHFMNPAPLIKAVEMIRGFHTSEETLRTAQEVMTRIGKTSIVVNDSPGFVSNRVLMLTINEAIFTVQEQIASPEEVDRIFTSCFGHKTGPLRTADLIGLDTILASLEVLLESFADSKFRPCTLLRRMVDAGKLGRKTGAGFFSYAEGGRS